MGIFDDAIREHLELKRHAGADDEELKELEDEAFGPPARPGDPDFPGTTSDEAAVDSEAGQPGGVFDADTPDADTSAGGSPEAEPPAPATPEGEAPEDAVAEAPSDEEPALTPLDQAVLPEEGEAQAEPPSEELAQPAEASPPAPPAEDAAPSDSGEGSPFSTAEREAIADQPTVFFEQQAPAELELGDLDLDLDEEIEEVGSAVDEPFDQEEPLIVEEAFAQPAAETEVAEPPHEAEPEPLPPEPESSPPESEPEPDAQPEPTSDFAAAEPGEAGTGEEDVLEETPEFLRDNPDDDELWFEQGEPKDFDF